MPSFYATLLGCALILPHLLCEIRCFLSNLLWRSLKFVRMSDRKSWLWKCGTASNMLHFLIMPYVWFIKVQNWQVHGLINWFKVIQLRSWHKISLFTSHTSHQPWPWNCESPKGVSKGLPKTLPKSCNVVTCPQL